MLSSQNGNFQLNKRVDIEQQVSLSGLCQFPGFWIELGILDERSNGFIVTESLFSMHDRPPGDITSRAKRAKLLPSSL